jgi:hypothetical protein
VTRLSIFAAELRDSPRLVKTFVRPTNAPQHCRPAVAIVIIINLVFRGRDCEAVGAANSSRDQALPIARTKPEHRMQRTTMRRRPETG